MIIQCVNKQPTLQVNGKLVNQLGKYLYKHLDGAYKFEITANTYDLYITVLYGIPSEITNRYNLTQEVNEMDLNINLTTYANKIRMNIIEISPEEQTLGHDAFTAEQLVSIENAYKVIKNKIQKRLNKAFEHYEFIF